MKAFALVLFLGGTLALKEKKISTNPLKDVTIENSLKETPSAYNYHEKYGIKHAARIRAAEEALDFDGSRITGGHLALNGDVPYMGGLAIVLTNALISICGSSLVTNTKLVTAAHCWWDGRSQALTFTVVLGWNMLYAGGTRVAARDVTVHPNWDPVRSVEDDIAVITINSVAFNDVIKPIELPSGSLLSANFAGEFAKATGYGRLADIQAWTNWFLYYVDLQILTNAACSQYWMGIVDTMMCTSGGEGRSTCRGDMGGPLAHNDNGREVLIGVASFVSQYGCQVGRPAGFTRVGPYVDWIRSQL